MIRKKDDKKKDEEKGGGGSSSGKGGKDQLDDVKLGEKGKEDGKKGANDQKKKPSRYRYRRAEEIVTPRIRLSDEMKGAIEQAVESGDMKHAKQLFFAKSNLH